MKDPIVRSLLEEIAKLNESAYSVSCKNFEEYLARLGEYRGLKKALDIVLSLNEDGEDS